MSVDLDHIQTTYAEADCLFSEVQVEAAIDRIAAEITEVLADTNPVLYTVMNGGLVFAGKLLTRLNFPLESSYLHATRYRNTINGGELDWKVPPEQNMEGRTVLIVDDILDEGLTLAAIIEFCNAQGAKEVLTAVLVNKLHDNKTLKSNFTGLNVEDRYLFGYGMDYQGYWRNAPCIFALKAE
ncbi:MAG: hypoxanthine-guanine phosphoribosyltransferase [Endozoicomonadaceae bacterium]|nr:hypoxanthine-guanine phosphoribosyltransferase [Endozoicomonadaceae bacterium]